MGLDRLARPRNFASFSERRLTTIRMFIYNRSASFFQPRGKRAHTAMPSPAAMGHLDCDCFYVSAERVRDHFLRDKPVGVLGNQGACVIAKSYEMKHTGVKTGMAIWDALRLY